MEEKEKAKMELMAKADKFADTKDIGLALSTNVDDALKEKMQENINPNKKENKKINEKIRKFWIDYRSNKLEQINLENYKKYCELEIIRAENDAKLETIKQTKEKSSALHWLDMHKGNLTDIGLNEISVPNKFSYSLLRFIFYFKKFCQNIHKSIWYILAGVLGCTVIYLIAVGLGKIGLI